VRSQKKKGIPFGAGVDIMRQGGRALEEGKADKFIDSQNKGEGNHKTEERTRVGLASPNIKKRTVPRPGMSYTQLSGPESSR